MSRQLRIVSLLLVALTAAALSSCGGNDEREAKNAYVRQLNSVQTTFASTLTSISQQLTPKSSATQVRRTLQRFQTAIDDQVRELRGITPRKEVAAEHKQIIDAIAGFGAEVKDANELLRNPTLQNIERWQRVIAGAAQTVSTRLDTATDALNSKLGSK